MKNKIAFLHNRISKNYRKKLKIALSGGPGVGKTSIVQALRTFKFEVKLEVFTELFERAEREGKFKDIFDNMPKLLHDLVLFQKDLESSQPDSGIVFYDRCMVDIQGFARNADSKFTDSDQKIVSESEYDLVFIVEPLSAMHYVQNSIRRQNYQESLEHHARVTEAYKNYCLQKGRSIEEVLVCVPDLRVEQTDGTSENAVEKAVLLRTQFIIDRLMQLE